MKQVQTKIKTGRVWRLKKRRKTITMMNQVLLWRVTKRQVGMTLAASTKHLSHIFH